MWSIFDIFVFVAGYVACIYSWPWIKVTFNGAMTEAQKLRDKAAALEASLRSKI